MQGQGSLRIGRRAAICSNRLTTCLAASLVWMLAAGGLAEAADSTVMLAFEASWCPNCKQMAPTVDSLEKEGFVIRRVDVDREQGLVQRMGIERIPTFVVMTGGREDTRFVGITDVSALRLALQPAPATRLGETSSTSPAINGPAFAGLPSPSLAANGPSFAPSEIAPSIREVMTASDEVAAAATVRLRVTDGNAVGIGSGTIIDVHGDEALVLTCGHIFRDSAGRAPVQIDLFHQGETITIPGQVIDYSAEERDVALVVCRPGIPVKFAPVAPENWQAQSGESVFSLGCDRGADPSRRDTRITAINKYLGPPNLEIAGAPVDGRSGGGLFNSAGQLIGVCNAADPQDDEGIYAGTAVVHWQLDRVNLGHLYREDSPPAAPSVALASTAPTEPPANSATTTPPVELTDQEVIVIVRDRNGSQGAARVLEFKTVPPQLAGLLQTQR